MKLTDWQRRTREISQGEAERLAREEKERSARVEAERVAKDGVGCVRGCVWGLCWCSYLGLRCVGVCAGVPLTRVDPLLTVRSSRAKHGSTGRAGVQPG